jgi:hypothetical protein
MIKLKKKPLIIAVDFNGTCMSYDYPNSIGKDIGAVPVLKKIVEAGHHIVIMSAVARTPEVPIVYDRYCDMMDWFAINKIPFVGVNFNPTECFRSNKLTADLYIDDHCLGIPLKEDPKLSNRPFVDWEKTEQLLIDMGVIE